MSTRRTKTSVTTNTNLQILASLHESMRKIRLAMWARDGVDPKLCRVYGEAVTQFVHARPQQQLLKEYDDATAKPGKSPGDRIAARV
jgi:hypothetical protein